MGKESDESTDDGGDINNDINNNDITTINTTHHRIIIKTNDFMRQEEMASNILHEVPPQTTPTI